MKISQKIAQNLISLVRSNKRYVGWKNFEDEVFQKNERWYKKATIDLAKELIDKPQLQRLIQESKFDEIINRLNKLGKHNNLLWCQVPLQGDLNILYQDDLNKKVFFEAFVDLLYGEGDSPERLQRYTKTIKERGWPNKWTFPTYFLFICHPDTEIFVKPRTSKWFLKYLGMTEQFSTRPSKETYHTIRSAGKQLKELLKNYGPRDMVDIQSLIWVSSRVDRGLEGAKKREEFDSLFQEFIDSYFHSETAQRHAEKYRKQRTECKENYASISKSAAQGEDVADAVLLKLLPYKDTKNNRKKGGWIHPAPAITKDLKIWFENAGWTKPKDWPEVTRVILQFIQNCIENPKNLAELCKIFAEKCPSKGFQIGMLSPALNALRPDAFVLINSKPRQVINYFAETSHGYALADYPDLNRTAFQLLDEYGDTLSLIEAPELLPCDVFDMFSHWMVAEKKFSFKEARIFRITPGENALGWDTCKEEEHISIGWSEFGDVSKMTKSEFQANRDELIKKYPNLTKKSVNQIWTFVNIRQGDRIIASKGKDEILGIGTVSGPYYFVPNLDLGHRLPLQWDDLTHRRVNEPSWSGAIQKISIERFEKLRNAPPIDGGPSPDPLNEEYPLDKCAANTGFSAERLERWVSAIDRKGQAILYGPPGTGKTYLAEHLAWHLIGGGNGFQRLIQFHPDYAYQDFIQGIRPQTRKDGSLSYEMVPGVFCNFCSEASRLEGKCVLIIDEINRANLSRVFGELMYLLEYRNAEVELSGGRLLKIPANVRIIGTMNTADRSIALVDYALRRRFAFLKLRPSYSVLESYHAESGFDVSGLIRVLHEVNAQINDPNYEVGISFFLRENIEDEIEDTWRMEIEPYLEEFFFDDLAKAELFTWDKVKDKIL